MTDRKPPAGWYPDATGVTRWWDGSSWTDQTRVNDTAAEATVVAAPLGVGPSATDAQQTAKALPVAGVAASTGEPVYKRRWAIGVAAGVAGLIIGAAASSGSAVEDSPEYKSVLGDLASAQGDAETLKADMEPMKAKVAATDAREKELDARESALSDREDGLKSDSAAIKKREKAVGIVEKDIKNNTVPGDGIYAVGDDIKAGTYKTKGGADCYYAVLRDTKGGLNSIVNNNNISGPGIVSVSNGQYLELSGCSAWVKQ